MLLSKAEQSYCYTQLCNYREQFVFKPISNQLNVLMGSNLRFTMLLIASYLIFSRLNLIKEFAVSFPSSTLSAVNLLL